MSRKRVGILISGRGSNMSALIEAARAPDYPAEIVGVLSNRAAAPGLGIAAATIAVVGYGVGILVERWLFFAEARHAVMNYYEG